jgi:hypothetical protein
LTAVFVAAKRASAPFSGKGGTRQEGVLEMSIKKSLLLSIATAAIAITALTPSAMGATDGVIQVVSPIIPNGTNVHLVGWARFQTGGSGIICHVTGTYEVTGTEGKTGDVKSFVLTTSTCEGFGVAYANCTVTADSVNGLPYHATATPTDLDVTGNIEITSSLSATPGKTCNFTFTNLFFEELTIAPLGTGTKTVTNTSNTLGKVVGANTPIAGVAIEGEGEAENNTATFPIAAEGELELTSPERCTYKLS